MNKTPTNSGYGYNNGNADQKINGNINHDEMRYKNNLIFYQK